ncbi:recQ-mediated genome instability protein 1 [Ambystoma mexicanum]|uniref:recQ-mediated genome instability protein 1 n=1 Tax=Ambystoma mexicanum TaxID=8296 RepID=UPI0037E74276
MMNASSVTSRVKTWLMSTWHVHVPDHWVEACIDWIQQEHSGVTLSQAQINKLVYEQWLLTDLRDLEHPVLPDGISGAQKCELNGCYSIQIDSLVDVSQPVYSQLQKLRGRNNQNEHVSDATQVSQKPWEAKPTRMLMVQLTDGVQHIQGMEYQPVPVLHSNIPPGTKICLQGNLTCRLGMLLLRPETVKILGGEVEALFEENSQERVLAALIGETEIYPPSSSNNQQTLTTHVDELGQALGPSDEELLASLDDDVDILVNNTTPSESGYGSRSNITSNSSSQTYMASNGRYNHQPDTGGVSSDRSVGMDREDNPEEFFLDEDLNDILGIETDLDDELFLEEEIQRECVEAELEHVHFLNENKHVPTRRFTELSISSPLANRPIEHIGLNDATEDLDDSPFTYISLLLASNNDRIKTVKIKGFIVTLTGNLTKTSGVWCINATISDGTAYLNADFSNQVLSKIIGFSVTEMKELKKNAKLRENISVGLLKCQQELIDLCCVMTITYTPSTANALVIRLQDVNTNDLESLKQRLQY